ncbi:MAG TPA: YwqG family protein [Sandaracinaceae bacterium LLY-WYZ-13_1]|nr:YwqG family protein [Sandaracinaceae bacterium LLY-WYZ-13_1]
MSEEDAKRFYEIDPESGHPKGLGPDFEPHLDRLTPPLPAVYFDYVEPPADPRRSRIGGDPFLPAGFEIPLGSEEQELAMLAQINFEDFDDLPGFPTQGILHVFVDADGEMYGYEAEPEDVQVVFHPDLHTGNRALESARLVPSEVPLEDDGFPTMPFPRPLGMRFHPVAPDFPQPDLAGEERRVPGYYPPFLGIESDTEVDGEMLSVALRERYNDWAHAVNYPKIGGFPCFFNDHPGESAPELYEHDRLLLQLPSYHIGDLSIGWWDFGTASFLIREEDLKKRDFSRVLYTIDA